MRAIPRKSRWLVVVALFWLWWAGGLAASAVQACNSNTVCEPQLGEHCENCGDCPSCICGDNYCAAEEGCDPCPQDCAEQCVCGDSICTANAECGGPGALPGPPCSECSGCTFCVDDCGGCDPQTCWPSVCNDEGSACVACDNDQQCQVWSGGSWCGRDDSCHDFCNWDFECPWGYYCSSGACQVQT